MNRLISLLGVLIFGFVGVGSVNAISSTYQIPSGNDDVNEVSNTLTTTGSTVWVGTGGSASASYAGFRFANVTIPQGSTITSAQVQLQSSSSQWLSIGMNMAFENTGNSAAWSTTSKPSQRTLTPQSVNHSSNVNWAVNTWYTLENMASSLQTVVNRPDWQSGNSVAVVMRGNVGTWGRKFVKSFENSATAAPRLLVTYDSPSGPTNTPTLILTSTPTPTLAPTSTPTPTSVPTNTPTPTPSPTLAPTSTPTPTPTPAVGVSFTTIQVGAGGTDVTPRNLVRTNSDKIYVFGNRQYSSTIWAHWMGATSGLPNSTLDFSVGTTVDNGANVIQVDAIYDGSNTIHVLVNDQNGDLKSYPFDLGTNTFRSPRLLASGNPTISGDYVGSGGVSGMIDTTGQLQIAFWGNGNRIVHRIYTYDQTTNSYTQLESNNVDASGFASHPQIVVAADNSLTVAWISQSTSPANILVRTRSAAGIWGNIEDVSSDNVWTSNFFGVNIDQGPSMVIDASGVRHLVYMEANDSSGDYGRIHYVKNAGGIWTDTELNSYTHDPAIAINASGEMVILGHGHPNSTTTDNECKSMLNMCAIINTGGGWGQQILVQKAVGSDNFDTSPSVKWSAVGWNRPETIEFAFSNVPNGQYNNSVILYSRINGLSPAPTNTPTPTILPPTPTPTPTLAPTSTPTPTPTPVVTGYGNALVFDGIDDEVNGSVYPSSNNTGTYEIWVRPSADNSTGILAHTRDNADTGGWIMELRNGLFEFWVYGTDGVDRSKTHPTVLAANNWYHLAATYDASSGNAQLFVNGQPDTTSDMGTMSVGNATRLGAFGQSGVAGPYASFNGQVDEFRVSSGLRYNSSFNVPTLPFIADASTVVLYNFNETSGQTLNDLGSGANNLTLGRNAQVEVYDPTRVTSGLTLGVPTPTPTPSPTIVLPTSTPTPTIVAPTNTPTPTPVVGVPVTVTYQLSSGSDDVNEVSGNMTSDASSVWVGTGGSATASYTGLRFTNINIPTGATITSARVQLQSSNSQWLSIGMNMAFENSSNSLPWTISNRPSQRPLTSQSVNHASDSNWVANTWYTLDQMAPALQTVVSSPDWQSGNAVSVIMRGNVGTWGRKFVKSFEAGGSSAARLVVTYTP